MGWASYWSGTGIQYQPCAQGLPILGAMLCNRNVYPHHNKGEHWGLETCRDHSSVVMLLIKGQAAHLDADLARGALRVFLPHFPWTPGQ